MKFFIPKISVEELFGKSLLSAIFFLSMQNGHCQYKYTDSLINVIRHAKSDSVKADAMYYLSYSYQVYKPDSALLIAQQLYDFSVEKKYFKGQSIALDGIAGAFLRMGDNTKALEYYLKRLKIEEERKSADNIAIIYMNIANVYNRDGDTGKASMYILKADSIIIANDYDDLKLYAFLNTGNILEKSNRHLPDALSYTRQCYQMAVAKNDSLMIGSALNNFGNIYYKLGDYDAAIKNYLQSGIYIRAVNDNHTLSEGMLGLAAAYQKKGLQDSVKYFALLAYNTSYNNGLLPNALASSKFLSDFYKERKSFDSAFHYQTIMVTLKDSLQGIEKIKQLESLSIQEQLRQNELAALRQREKEEYRQRLQLLAIGIAIPFFFFFSIFISQRKVNRRVIHFFGILSLLLLFEYITLFLHPWVAEITHHSPLLEIVIFVLIAALMVPAHHKIEHWFIKRLATNYEEAKNRKQKAKTEALLPGTQEIQPGEGIADAGEKKLVSPLEDVPAETGNEITGPSQAMPSEEDNVAISENPKEKDPEET